MPVIRAILMVRIKVAKYKKRNKQKTTITKVFKLNRPHYSFHKNQQNKNSPRGVKTIAFP